MIFGTVYGEVCAVKLSQTDNKGNNKDDYNNNNNNYNDIQRRIQRTTRGIYSLGNYGDNIQDTILGLAWLRNDSKYFIAGSSHGRICLGDSSKILDMDDDDDDDDEGEGNGGDCVCFRDEGGDDGNIINQRRHHSNVGDERDDIMMVEDHYDDNSGEDDEGDENYDDSDVDVGVDDEDDDDTHSTHSNHHLHNNNNNHHLHNNNTNNTPTISNRNTITYNNQPLTLIKQYPSFHKLTSVHVNNNNTSLLVSGYSTDINIYDIETGSISHQYKNIHNNHINISRFCNLSPYIFATSSFDKTIKTWDLRQSNLHNNNNSIYTLYCNHGIVMINFSYHDTFLLASALDNEINQYVFMTGTKHLTYDLPKTGLLGNFTRSYYSASGRYVITGM